MPKHRPRYSGTVYSTEYGRMCPDCNRPKDKCRCKKGGKDQSSGVRTPNDGIVRVGRQTKGRKGKGVTIVTGLPFKGDALKDYASKLKAKCGTGGTVKGNTVEIQGDQRDRLVKILSDDGYTVKKSGG